MKHFRVRNFEKFQHYKHRSPPWIKLHSAVLEKYKFSSLPDATKAHLMMIWLLASRMDNKIPWDPRWIAQKVGAKTRINLKLLQDLDFIECIQDASDVLAKRYQNADSEKSRDREEKSREDTSARPQANGQHDFEEFKAAYPKRQGSQPWTRAMKAANARIRAGHSFDEMIEGAQRYAAFCDATDKTGTEYVMQAATFLGPERHFINPWTIPQERESLIERAERLARTL